MSQRDLIVCRDRAGSVMAHRCRRFQRAARAIQLLTIANHLDANVPAGQLVGKLVGNRQRLAGLPGNYLVAGIIRITCLGRKPLIRPARLCRNALAGTCLAVEGIGPKRGAGTQDLSLSRRERARFVRRRLNQDIGLCIQSCLGRHGRLDSICGRQCLAVGAFRRSINDVTVRIDDAHAKALATELGAKRIIENNRCARLALNRNKGGAVRIKPIAYVGSEPLISSSRNIGPLAGGGPDIGIERRRLLDKADQVGAGPASRCRAHPDANAVL